MNPDLLLVLGDVSAKGSKLSISRWSSVLNQFHRILGPFLGLPFHVTLGDRDLGKCGALDKVSVNRVVRNFPGLDSAGCGAFEISNVSFVSLNTVAMLCGNNKLRFGVERIIERESIYLRPETEAIPNAIIDSGAFGETYEDFTWRENSMLPRSGPVLLLHFPLHRTVESMCSLQNESR